MKNKKIITFMLLISLCAGTLCACNGSKTENIEPAPQEESTEEYVGMPNPMVEVSSDDAFMQELGFAIDTSYFPNNGLEKFIIGGELAHVAFNVSDPEGKDVKCTFRGTKNDEWNKNPLELIAGNYATDFSEPSELTLPATDEDIIFKTVYSESSKTTISYFDYKGVHYTLTVEGNISQMLMAELNDSSLYAIGAVISGDEAADSRKYITPYPETVDLENIEDAMFNARLENIRKEDDSVIADVTLYTMDLYDMVDMNTLSVDDVIYVDGKDIDIESVEDGDPIDFHDGEGKRDVKVINGGWEAGGVEFVANEGGTYRCFGMDDYASYTEQGSVTLKIAGDATINDTSDLDHQEGLTLSTEDLPSLKDKEFDPGFSLLNTKIRIVNNEIVEINRWFIP